MVGREPRKRVSQEALVNYSWRHGAAASTPPLGITTAHDEMTVSERDIAAFVVATLLGAVGTYLDVVVAGYFALPGMFILCGFFFPLLASLFAERRIILAGLIPNVVMMVGLVIYFLIVSTETHLWTDTFYLLAIMLIVGLFLSLVVSVPIQLLRNRRAL